MPWLERFFSWNRRLADHHWTPRLYPVTQVAALDYWMSQWVGTVAFRSGTETLLEFGCGETFHLTRLVGQRFATRCATDLVDVSAEAKELGIIFSQCSSTAIPFPDGSVDVIVLRSVIEHLDDPCAVFREFARVLRPDGLLFANVPNRWDYVSVIARLAGSKKTTWLRRSFAPNWEDFPVFYRCNTPGAIRRIGGAAGFTPEVIRPLPSEPAYLRFFLPMYLCGALYQFVVSLCSIDILQPSFMVVLRKSGTPA